MNIIKKFEYEVDVWVDAWSNGDEDTLETFTLVSTEEYFSIDDRTEIAIAHGGFRVEDMRAIKTWYETV